MPDDDAWFAPKRYGYGTGLPITWQGWAVVVAYAAMLALAGFLLPDHRLAFIATVTVATVMLLAVCASRTRGGWRWRTGDDD